MDRAVGALAFAQAAADAPVANANLADVAAVDGADRAADHAHRVEALAARNGRQVVAEPRAVEVQPRVAVVVHGDARLDALAAARAAVEVDEHQPLALHQAEVLELRQVAQAPILSACAARPRRRALGGGCRRSA